ncbi:MAG: hypothetical protein FWF76_06435 [Oscillospiraceae bacterium]|nr:hypothetical protein [Oscillospiraceae bacterium]
MKKSKKFIALVLIITLAIQPIQVSACPHFDETGREFSFGYNEDFTIQSMIYFEIDELSGKFFVHAKDFPMGSIEHDPADSGIIVGNTYFTPHDRIIGERFSFSLYNLHSPIEVVDNIMLSGSNFKLNIGLENSFVYAMNYVIESDEPREKTFEVRYEIEVNGINNDENFDWYDFNHTIEHRFNQVSWNVLEISANMFAFDFTYQNPPIPVSSFRNPVTVYMQSDPLDEDVFAINIKNLSETPQRHRATWDEEKFMYSFEIEEPGIYALVTDAFESRHLENDENFNEKFNVWFAIIPGVIAVIILGITLVTVQNKKKNHKK